MPTFTARRHLQMPVTPARGLSPSALPTTRERFPHRARSALPLALSTPPRYARPLSRSLSPSLALPPPFLALAFLLRVETEFSRLSLSLARARIPSFRRPLPRRAALFLFSTRSFTDMRFCRALKCTSTSLPAVSFPPSRALAPRRAARSALSSLHRWFRPTYPNYNERP